MDDPRNSPQPSAPPPFAPPVPPQVPPHVPQSSPPPWPPPYVPPVQYGPAPAIPLGGHGAPLQPTGYPAAPPAFAPVPSPTFTVRVTSVAPRARAAATVAILGAAVLAGATFLPWLRADVEGLGLRSGNGWTNVVGATGWGPLLVLFAVVAAGAAAPAAANVRSPAAVTLSLTAAGLAAVVAVYQLVDIGRSRPGIDVELRYGAFTLVAASVVSLTALVVVALSGRGAKVIAPRAVGAVG